MHLAHIARGVNLAEIDRGNREAGLVGAGRSLWTTGGKGTYMVCLV